MGTGGTVEDENYDEYNNNTSPRTSRAPHQPVDDDEDEEEERGCHADAQRVHDKSLALPLLESSNADFVLGSNSHEDLDKGGGDALDNLPTEYIDDEVDETEQQALNEMAAAANAGKQKRLIDAHCYNVCRNKGSA